MMIYTSQFDGRDSAGFGSILQILQHLYAYSRLNNSDYYFNGFHNLSHYQYINEEQKLFNEKLSNFINMNNTPNGETELINDNFLVKTFSKTHNDLKRPYISEMANKIIYDGPKYYKTDNKTIAIHIRSKNPKDNCFLSEREYFDVTTKIPFYVNLINQITDNKLWEYDIHIFSQGNEKDFHFFKYNFGATLHINDDLVNTFYHLIYSDYLITSNSSLSWSAHLYGQNKKVYGRNNFFHEWYSDVILIDKNGNFI